jgi:tetratricopeptide (TPR) repeat protein
MSGNTLADAVASWRNGRRAQAEQICRALIAQDSRLVDAYRLLAEIFASSGRAEAALAACHRVAELAPADAPIWLMMGGLLLSLWRPQEALAAFDQAIARVPSLARAHAGRGLTLIGLGRDVEAVEALTRAVRIDPQGAAPVLLQAGYQMMQLGRPDAALGAFARLAQLQPDSLAARQGHAIALVTMRRYAEAAPELAALLKANPGADYLAGVALHAKRCCDWSGDNDAALITHRVRQARAPISAQLRRTQRSPADHGLRQKLRGGQMCARCAARGAGSTPELGKAARRLSVFRPAGTCRGAVPG